MLQKLAPIVLFLMLSAPAAAYNLRIQGQVDQRSTTQPMHKVLVRVYKNGVKQHVLETSATGRFSVVLDNGADYVVRCSAPGFVTKCFGVDTHGLVWEGEDKRKDLSVTVEMIENDPGMDLGFFDMPLGMLRFQPATGLVTWDKAYQAWIEPRTEAIMAEYDRRRAALAQREPVDVLPLRRTGMRLP
ncbi:MAG: hypothetical protein JNM31_06185 [Flavobacteriales bacterium]|nr:hypothetical protein [Flavobacteriales bacterium]